MIRPWLDFYKSEFYAVFLTIISKLSLVIGRA